MALQNTPPTLEFSTLDLSYSLSANDLLPIISGASLFSKGATGALQTAMYDAMVEFSPPCASAPPTNNMKWG